METLQLLGVALGLAALSGINLYLTVFATGLAVRMQWIALAEPYSELVILADPVIIILAGVLFFFEFFADKVPWIDSMWDSVHTVIRPLGAAFLAITVLGEPNQVFDVIVGLLAGGTALTTHGLKATTRLVANASPEPFSNIGLSLAEDGLVVGCLALLWWNPLVGLLLVILGLAAAWVAAPRLLRLLTSRVHFAWRKLTSPAENSAEDLPKRLPVDVDCALHLEHPGKVRTLWALPAVTAKIPGTPANLRGTLVALAGEGEEARTMDAGARLYWGGRSLFRRRLASIEAADCKLDYRRGFLFDRAILYNPTSKKRLEILFDRPTRRLAERALESCFKPSERPSATPAAIDYSGQTDQTDQTDRASDASLAASVEKITTESSEVKAST